MGVGWIVAGPGRAGSRRRWPGCEGWRWRRARLITALEHLDDDHDAATARAGRSGLCIVGRFLGRGRRDIEQTSRAFEMILAACAGEEAIVADAVESARQGVEEEAADGLVCGEGQDLLPSGAERNGVGEGTSVSTREDLGVGRTLREQT